MEEDAKQQINLVEAGGIDLEAVGCWASIGHWRIDRLAMPDSATSEVHAKPASSGPC